MVLQKVDIMLFFSHKNNNWQLKVTSAIKVTNRISKNIGFLPGNFDKNSHREEVVLSR